MGRNDEVIGEIKMLKIRSNIFAERCVGRCELECSFQNDKKCRPKRNSSANIRYDRENSDTRKLVRGRGLRHKMTYRIRFESGNGVFS